MYWLAHQIEIIQGLSEHYSKQSSTPSAQASTNTKARQELQRALDRFTHEVIQRPGVLASFVAHDGFILASAGTTRDPDALAAVAQQCAGTFTQATQTLSMGIPSQMVIIASEFKLVLFPIHEMVLGIMSPHTTTLSSALSQ